MSKCLRCGAGSEWLQGKVFSDIHPDGLAAAWARYEGFFGEPPHGTKKQMAALLELVPESMRSRDGDEKVE